MLIDDTILIGSFQIIVKTKDLEGLFLTIYLQLELPHLRYTLKTIFLEK